MEIHAPEHPVQTWRDFLRHILIVTVGILIALSLEGLLEWRHHRVLAREARENILQELTSNRRAIDSVLAKKEQVERDISTVLAYVDDRSGTQPRPKEYNFFAVGINTAGWSSAQATGALAHMSFDEVQQYAGVYTAQQQFVTSQQEVLRDSVLMCASPNFEKPTPQELDAWRLRIKTLQASYQFEIQIAQALAKAYRELLAEHGIAAEPPADPAKPAAAP